MTPKDLAHYRVRFGRIDQFLKARNGSIWRTLGHMGQGADDRLRFNAMPVFLPEDMQEQYCYDIAYSLEAVLEDYVNVNSKIQNIDYGNRFR